MLKIVVKPAGIAGLGALFPPESRYSPENRLAQAAATFLAGIVIAATPVTTQAKPVHAVEVRLSPSNSTPSATPIGTRK